MHCGKKASQRRQCETLGPSIHVDVTFTNTVYLPNIVPDQDNGIPEWQWFLLTE